MQIHWRDAYVALRDSWLNLFPHECNGSLLAVQNENIALRRNASAIIYSSQDFREDFFTVISVKYCF